MPAAELFTVWAVSEAARPRLPFHAVISVGDCQPAAGALNAASSGTPQMAALLTAIRDSTKQWLGVHVTREKNQDADRLSHPELLPTVLRETVSAGFSPNVQSIPNKCWEILHEIILLPAEFEV